MKKFIIALILISSLSLWPFFKKGFFESHDGEWMVIRFTAFHQSLISGQFPVRLLNRLNNNYGYPVTNFLYPLPFYFAEIPKILGFSYLNSIKLVFVGSSILSVTAMFWALSQVFNKYASLSGAIVYLYIPYRFVDLYVRGSIGENLAFMFIPLVLLSIFKIQNNNKLFIGILTISIGGLVLSHNVIAALFIPLLIIFSLLKTSKNIIDIIKGYLLGILISAFFWIPAIYDLKYVNFSQIKISEINDHLVNISNLIIPNWGYGSTPGSIQGLSVQLGLTTFAVVLIYIWFRLIKKIKSTYSDVFVLILIFIVFLMTKLSLPLWNNIPFLDVIQFPWRMLAVVVFISSFLTAMIIENSNKKLLFSLLIVTIAIISSISYAKPLKFIERPEGFYETNEATTTVRDEYLSVWVKEKPKFRSDSKIHLLNGSAEVDTQSELHPYKAEIIAKEESSFIFNKIYFPGYEVYSNNHKVDISYQNPNGLISFKLPQGNNKVIIKYGKTTVHQISELISLITVVITSLIFIYYLRKNYNLNQNAK